MSSFPTSWTLTILGAPRTKKNSGSVIVRNTKGGKPRKYHIASAAYQAWVTTAKVRWPPGAHRPAPGVPLPALPMNCAAIFYQDADRADLIGLLQGLGDFLQARRIIANDYWLQGFDGSRPAVDRNNPRVELTLSRMNEMTLALLSPPA